MLAEIYLPETHQHNQENQLESYEWTQNCRIVFLYPFEQPI